METNLKILHLESISADAEIVASEVKKGISQFEILVVSTKIAFIKALDEFCPNILLTDHKVPSLDSIEAIKIIQQKEIKIPVILVSSIISDDCAMHIMEAGGYDYILKDRLRRLPIAILNAVEKNSTKKQLNESEKINKGILSSISAHIAVIDESGELVAVNKAWDDYRNENTSTPLDRVSKGSNYFEVCQTAFKNGDMDAEKALNGIQSVFKKDQNYFEMEYTINTPNQQQWFLLNAVNFGGDSHKVVISHQNITQRKIAENSLNETSAKLQKTVNQLSKIFDASLDVICTINAYGEFVSVSAASEKVWGYKPIDLIGTKFMNLVYLKDAERTAEAAEKIYKGIKIPIFENRYVHKNGKIVPLLWSINWDEKIGLMCAIAKDVTEKLNFEKAIKHERDQFYDMLLKAPSAIGMLRGANHIFEMANPLYLQLIGKMDIIDKPLAEVFPELVEQGFIKRLDKVYQTGEPFSGTEMLVKIDKEGSGELTDFYINFIYQAYKNSNGEIDGVFCFINDITEEVLTKKKIEKSEKQYRLIVETAQEGIWLADEELRIIFVNKKICEILGYTEEEVIGKKYTRFMDEHGKKKAMIALQRIKMGIAESFELAFLSKDGTYIYTYVSANPIYDDLGNFKGSLGMVTNITDKKLADKNNLFKANLLNTIGQAAIATDLEGIVIYWNKAAEDIYGWKMEEALGKKIMDLTTTISSIEHASEIMEQLRQGQTWVGEFRVKRKDGTEFPASIVNSSIYDENNKPSGIIGISSDITEKKKMEALLDKSNRLARLGSWEIDVEKETVYWSDITKEIREAEPDFVPDLKTGIGLFTQGKDKNIISKRLQDCIENGTPWDEELQITTFKGKLKWIRTIGEAEIINGKCSKVYGSFQDISERKKAESERVKMISDIIQRNADLEQFSYIVSHNLRAPAANIIGFAEILKDDTLTSHEQNEALHGLSESVTGLDTIIKDINAILQIKRQIHEPKEIINLTKLVHDIVISIDNLIDRNRVEIVTDFSEVNEIFSLKVYLYSIFFNLISNSVKYSKPNEHTLIKIKSNKDNGNIILTFEDNGLGIDIQGLGSKVFGLYNRFHSHVEGKGMGLFMVKTQVEILGGNIAVESKPNHGTKFKIVFET